MLETLENKLKQIPKKTGVYHFLGDKRKILYVGKAKDLRSRVKSYFRSSGLSKRIQMMVAQIADLEWIVTVNEHEALVLENSHIKTFKPKFNILFRDDKSYPYLRFSQEKYPRVSYYRSRSQNNLIPNSPKKPIGENCLGPYPDPSAVREVISILQKIFGIRTCSNSIFNNRNRPCLLYQINRCSAPCVNLISETEYHNSIKLALKFVTGKMPEVFEELETKMKLTAKEQNYESAAKYRDQLQALRVTASAQRIIGCLLYTSDAADE